jgi:hypothetical protein
MAMPVKPNESDITSEPVPHEARPTPREAELPELAVRILSDFARIVAAEARLLESNIVEAGSAFRVASAGPSLSSILCATPAFSQYRFAADVHFSLTSQQSRWPSGGRARASPGGGT